MSDLTTLINTLTNAAAAQAQLPLLADAIVIKNTRVQELERRVAELEAAQPTPAYFTSSRLISPDEPDLVLVRNTPALPIPQTTFFVGSVTPAYWAGRSITDDFYIPKLLAHLSSGDTSLINDLKTAMDGYETFLKTAPKDNAVNEVHFAALITLHALVMRSHKQEWR